MIRKCTCKHKAQDKLYGPGNRMKNPGKPRTGTKIPWRCTVCGKVEE